MQDIRAYTFLLNVQLAIAACSLFVRVFALHAVNEMKTRRIQKAEKVVESEQKLAASPLQEPETNYAAQHEAPPILFSNREERIETVGAGLDQLMAQGYEQFTLGDLSAVTGINRKYLSKLIRPYEKSERIFAVRRSKTGNIYAFKQSAPDEDDAQEELVQQKRPDIDTGHSQYVISASEKRNDAEQDAPAAIPPGETRKDGYSNAVMNRSNGEMEILGGQDAFPLFVEAAKYAKGDNVTEYDDKIDNLWRNAVSNYVAGNLTREQAIEMLGLQQDASIETA